MIPKMKAQHKENIEQQEMEMSGDGSMTAKDTLDTVMDTVNANKLLIGSIAVVGCGAALFLLATEQGKRVRSEIHEKYLDLSDLVSVQASNVSERLREITKEMLSTQDAKKTSPSIRRVA